MLRRIGAGAGLGAGMGALGVGWFYSSVLLDTTRRPEYPEQVLAVDRTTVTLAANRMASQPGTWGLRWATGLTVVGSVESTSRSGIVRRLLNGSVPPLGAVMLDASPFDPDPGAVGLAFTTVDVHTPLGPCPAWLVPTPADGDTWVVMVHGRGGARREALRILPTLHEHGFPALVISYRNDDGAPPSPDGLYHLGDTEWADLEAAVQLARAKGARRIVLYGWSMGAAIIAAFLDRSLAATSVVAVVWDAPLVDWRATLRQQARNRRLPPGLTPLATSITSRRIGIDFDRFDLRRNPPSVRPPTLVIHTDEDTVVPVAPSRALAAAASRLDWPMHYVEVLGVEHTAAWNADPRAYEQAVTAFLMQVLR